MTMKTISSFDSLLSNLTKTFIVIIKLQHIIKPLKILAGMKTAHADVNVCLDEGMDELRYVM